MRVGAATTLRCDSVSPVKFARQIEFDNLRLYAIEHFQTGGAPVDRRRSSLASGTLYLDALNAKSVPLRPFEDLAFGSSKGYIRVLTIVPDNDLPGRTIAFAGACHGRKGEARCGRK